MIEKVLASIKALDRRAVYTAPVITVDAFKKRVKVRMLNRDIWASYSPVDIPDMAENDQVAVSTVDNRLLSAFVVCRIPKMAPRTLDIVVV